MSKRTGRKLAPFIAMDRHQHKSAAFAQLSAEAQALLVHLTYNYNTKMMNTVFLSTRDAAKKLNVCRSAAAYALQELEHYGFIVKVKGAHLGVEGVGKAALYRLTAQAYGNIGATHDYDKWDGELFGHARRTMTQADRERLAGRKKQNPVHTVSHPVHTVSHKGAQAAGPEMEQVSIPRAIRTARECPNREPYLVSPSSSAAEVPQDSRQPEPAPGPKPALSGLSQWSPPPRPTAFPKPGRFYCEVMGEPEGTEAATVRVFGILVE